MHHHCTIIAPSLHHHVMKLHIKAKKWTSTENRKAAQKLFEEQRHEIIAITEALSAFPIERQKANANKMEESLAGLSRNGLIIP